MTIVASTKLWEKHHNRMRAENGKFGDTVRNSQLQMLGSASCIATFSYLEAGLSSGAIPVDDSRALACRNTGRALPGNVSSKSRSREHSQIVIPSG